MFKYSRQEMGKRAEDEACHFFLKKGFLLLERNYHCRYGEIDLIMQKGVEIIFIEVRARSRSDYGTACESIDKSKQQRLLKSAQHFLHKMKLYKVYARFDVVTLSPTNNQFQLEWFKNAFSEDDRN